MPIGRFSNNGAQTAKPMKVVAVRGRTAQEALARNRIPEDKRVGSVTTEMDRDYQVRFSRHVLTAMLQAIELNMEVQGGDSRAQRLSEQLKELWDESLFVMCDSIRLGRAAFEKVFDTDIDQGEALTIIRKLDPLPYDLTEIVIEEDGAFGGIKLMTKKQREAVPIPPDKAWWLALDPSALEPHGRSRYLGAAWQTWRDRQTTLKQRNTFVDRRAGGQFVAHIPFTELDENNDEIDMVDAMGEAFAEWKSGGCMFLKNDRHQETNEYTYQIEEIGSPNSSAIPINDIVGDEDSEQLRAFGIPEKTVTEGDSVGSFAMVNVQMMVLLAVVEEIMRQFVASFQQYVIDKSIELNWPEGSRPVIKATFERKAKRPEKGQIAPSDGDSVQSPGVGRFSEAFKPPQIPPSFQPQNAPTQPLAAANEPGIPTQVLVTDSAVAEASRTMNTMFHLALGLRRQGSTDVSPLIPLQNRLRELFADTAIATKLLGMASPWMPQLQDNPSGGVEQLPLELAIRDTVPVTDGLIAGDKFRFPWISRLFDFLLQRRVVASDELPRLAAIERSKVFSLPGITSTNLLEEIRDELTLSVSEGESVDVFRRRIEDRFGVSAAHVETQYRTAAKQGYIDGQDTVLKRDEVSVAFPYMAYIATRDGRVRPHHLALDGVTVSRSDTQALATLQKAATDWNCRCSLIPLNRQQAEGRKISTHGELPADVRLLYG